jgi:HrpA-like RNA helicase
MAVLKKRMMNQDRKPFKLVIMSATIDASKFMAFFNSNALIKIEGRTFPTEVYNIFEPIENYV